MVRSIIGVVVPFKPHAKNVHILSPFADWITNVELPPHNEQTQFVSKFRRDLDPNEHVTEHCAEISLVALLKEDQHVITTKYFITSLARPASVWILDHLHRSIKSFS